MEHWDTDIRLFNLTDRPAMDIPLSASGPPTLNRNLPETNKSSLLVFHYKQFFSALTSFFLITGSYNVPRREWVQWHATYHVSRKSININHTGAHHSIRGKTYRVMRVYNDIITSDTHCHGSSWGYDLYTPWPSADYNLDTETSWDNLLITPKTCHSTNASHFLIRGTYFKLRPVFGCLGSDFPWCPYVHPIKCRGSNLQ